MKPGMKILAVDDEENVLKSIKRVITSRHSDITVDLSSTPNQCLNMIRDNKYDLVISDLLMPWMDGVELTDKIKEIIPDQKIIIITGYPTIKKYADAVKSGVCNFIPKPYTRDELLTAINILF